MPLYESKLPGQPDKWDLCIPTGAFIFRPKRSQTAWRWRWRHYNDPKVRNHSPFNTVWCPRSLEFSATHFIEGSAFHVNSGNMELIYCCTVAVNHVAYTCVNLKSGVNFQVTLKWSCAKCVKWDLSVYRITLIWVYPEMTIITLLV